MKQIKIPREFTFIFELILELSVIKWQILLKVNRYVSENKQ